MRLTKRRFEERDWAPLEEWAEADGVEFSREYVEATSPFRVAVENGDGVVAMFGWAEHDGLPLVHVIEKPKARSLSTWNAVYDLVEITLRDCGYPRMVAMVPHGAKIGSAIRRKGWVHASDLYTKEL